MTWILSFYIKEDVKQVICEVIMLVKTLKLLYLSKNEVMENQMLKDMVKKKTIDNELIISIYDLLI